MFRLGFRAGIWVSRLDLRPEAYILTWSAGPEGPDDLCLALGYGMLDWNLGFKDGIRVSKRDEGRNRGV